MVHFWRSVVLAIFGFSCIMFMFGNCTGCAKQDHTYELQSGEKVVCVGTAQYSCGMWLGNCNTGLEYRCQTNVKKLD